MGAVSVPGEVGEVDKDLVMISGITDFPPSKLQARSSTPKAVPNYSPYNTPPSMGQLYIMTGDDVATDSVTYAPFAQGNRSFFSHVLLKINLSASFRFTRGWFWCNVIGSVSNLELLTIL